MEELGRIGKVDLFIASRRRILLCDIPELLEIGVWKLIKRIGLVMK